MSYIDRGEPIILTGALYLTISGPSELKLGEEAVLRINLLNQTGCDLKEIVIKNFLASHLIKSMESNVNSVSLSKNGDLKIEDNVRDGEELDFEVGLKIKDASELGCIKYGSFKSKHVFPTNFEGKRFPEGYVVGRVKIYQLTSFKVITLRDPSFELYINGTLLGENVYLDEGQEYNFKIVVKKKGVCLKDIVIENALPKQFKIKMLGDKRKVSISRAGEGYNITIFDVEDDIEEILLRFTATFEGEEMIIVSPRMVIEGLEPIDGDPIVFVKKKGPLNKMKKLFGGN